MADQLVNSRVIDCCIGFSQLPDCRLKFISLFSWSVDLANATEFIAIGMGPAELDSYRPQSAILEQEEQSRWWTCFCHFPAGSTATRIRVLRISSEDGARLVIVGITQVIVVIIVINPVPFLALSGAVSPQVLQLCFPEREERRRRLAGQVRLVGEENALIVVVTGGINPRKADELDGAVIGDVFQGEGLEIELAVVIVLDHKRPWNADALVPFECYVVRALARR
nr:hypothetical protein L484_000162 [Ipomoea trifida]